MPFLDAYYIQMLLYLIGCGNVPDIIIDDGS